MTTILTDEIRGFIGRQSESVTACDAVEPGAVRRYAQAIMADDDTDYAPAAQPSRYGGPVAPPIYPASHEGVFVKLFHGVILQACAP